MSAEAAVTPIKSKGGKDEQRTARTIVITHGDLREQKVIDYLVTLDAGTRPEDYLDVHVALPPGQHALRVYDRIAGAPRDEIWYAEFLVSDSGPGWARLVLLRAVDLPKRKDVAESRVPAGHKIYRGNQDEQWCVFRELDGLLMSSGFASHEIALRWLLDHATLRNR